MTTRLRDLDGARTMNIEVKGGSLFLWAAEFCYEFDLALALHALKMEVGVAAVPEAVMA